MGCPSLFLEVQSKREKENLRNTTIASNKHECSNYSFVPETNQQPFLSTCYSASDYYFRLMFSVPLNLRCESLTKTRVPLIVCRVTRCWTQARDPTLGSASNESDGQEIKDRPTSSQWSVEPAATRSGEGFQLGEDLWQIRVAVAGHWAVPSLCLWAFLIQQGFPEVLLHQELGHHITSLADDVVACL